MINHTMLFLKSKGYLHNGILHLVANGFALLHVADLLRTKITEMEQVLFLESIQL